MMNEAAPFLADRLDIDPVCVGCFAHNVAAAAGRHKTLPSQVGTLQPAPLMPAGGTDPRLATSG